MKSFMMRNERVAMFDESCKLTFSQYVLIIIASATLILSNYYLIVDFNFIYRLFFLLFMALCVMEKKAMRVWFTYPGACIALFVFVLGLMAFEEYGDRIGNSFVGLIKNTPFFMIGFFMAGRQRQFRRWILFPVLMVYAVIALCYLYTIPGYDVANRQEVAALFTDDVDGMVGAFIYYYPTQVFVLFMGISMLDDKSKLYRRLALGCVGTILLQIVFSFWATPLIMLIIGANIFFIQVLMSRNILYRKKVIYIVILTVVSVFVTMAFETLGTIGGAGQHVTMRLFRVLMAPFESGTFDTLDYYSDGRLRLSVLSLESFMNNPLLGVGDYWQDSNIGGHSFWTDTLGKYGLIGSFPIWAFGISGLIISWRNFRAAHSKFVDCALMMILFTWFFAAFLNPYLFGTLGYFLFLAAGLAVGRYKMLKNLRRPIIQAKNKKCKLLFGNKILAEI